MHSPTGLLLLLSGLICGGAAAPAPRLAVLDFSLTNTSPQATTSAETARLQRLSDQLRRELAERFTVIDATHAQTSIDAESIRYCNGCELDIARKLGADEVAYGWVQKVSNLILNINLVIEDATTGKTLKADSVDIRGNTDESWSRGLHYLLNERLFRQP